ncbi:MAG: plasmid pRiA4b ORF-3 family protein, partial [Spirochaetaceae bacterium]|nr:plasmid pRiA4b ORF-3 family protein [Spirochaetaceae bacterium]
ARCVAGEYAAPPERIEGPLRFRRFISALDSHNDEERRGAQLHLGSDFQKDFFDLNQCNIQIKHVIAQIGQKKGT